MQVVTLKPHRYRSKLRAVGEEYEIAARADVHLFKALGWVIESPEKVAAPVVAVKVVPVPVIQVAEPVVEMAEVAAAPVEGTELPAPETIELAAEVSEPLADVTPKRTYKRRDLSAE